ncbi:hypothetical protein GUITHDRAFT_103636 [Guillardia theta CCMP2712]|uniref:Serine hydrolase domain-containing protein n=1 Tax=Guillardia theta (strain CCMP2712) TaxID=905079 RepID=L1JQP0_GUITC|nr:hypothetical protein GUITHDRAFT_103636 [Guillardia theta CCMP2712]EKX50403.1 hypothetical protein GUITHDRAFT_103636 [Guillardia theta CCMP2712]|eukprot:XP_005837383.1 hypothetical protein GUITHDRAFT_103636 [Guillardia theta CCMP2712]
MTLGEASRSSMHVTAHSANMRCCRPMRVMCVHGWRTSPSIMEFQTAELRKRLPGLEFHFMAGHMKESEACDPTIATLFEGPYYAHWGLHQSESEQTANIKKAVHDALEFIKKNGPFQCVIGFSQVKYED